MKRLVKIARVLLPLLVGGGAAAVRLQAGEAGAALLLLALGGALLGGAVALSLESLAAMVGLLDEQGLASQERRAELERELQTLLRSIKDAEIDGALRKLEPEQARELAEPLRRRALELLGELDRVRLQGRAGIEEQIERELSRRLGGSEGQPAGEAAP